MLMQVNNGNNNVAIIISVDDGALGLWVGEWTLEAVPLNSAGEQKLEAKVHLLVYKCMSNNVYKFSDCLPVITLVESINDDCHQKR